MNRQSCTSSLDLHHKVRLEWLETWRPPPTHLQDRSQWVLTLTRKVKQPHSVSVCFAGAVTEAARSWSSNSGTTQLRELLSLLASGCHSCEPCLSTRALSWFIFGGWLWVWKCWKFLPYKLMAIASLLHCLSPGQLFTGGSFIFFPFPQELWNSWAKSAFPHIHNAWGLLNVFWQVEIAVAFEIRMLDTREKHKELKCHEAQQRSACAHL